MAKYLDYSGLQSLWAKIKAKIPTKVSDLTNDAGYLTSVPVSNWDENDNTSGAYIQNRTHYKTSLGYVASLDMYEFITWFIATEYEESLPDINKTYAYTSESGGVVYFSQDYVAFPTDTFDDLNTSVSTVVAVIDDIEYNLSVYYTQDNYLKTIYYYNDNVCVRIQEYSGYGLFCDVHFNTAYSSFIINIPISHEMFSYSTLDDNYLNGYLIKKGTGTNSEIFNGADAKLAAGEYSHAEGRGSLGTINMRLSGEAGSTQYNATFSDSTDIYKLNCLTDGSIFYNGNQTDIDILYLNRINDTEATIYLSGTLDENNSLNNRNGYSVQYSGLAAISRASHAEGINTISSGNAAHAEGEYTIASETAAHAEGSYSIASGNAAHAEGSGKASGYYSHAEGEGQASGWWSHAEGISTASGNSSHAEGYYTIANHRSQHVFGEYNVADTSNEASIYRGNYIEIVGKGTKDSARSNARTLDWNGNEVLAGKLTVGASPTNDMDVATKQYVDSKTITLNGTATTSPSFYAPTSVGTDGYVLKSGGSGAPSWVAQSTLSVGSATTATKFNSDRTIALTGDVTGSVSSDGTSGWSIATTVGDNSHSHNQYTIVNSDTFGIYGGIDPLTAPFIGSAASNKSFGLPASAITIEYSTDGGTTWVDYSATDAQKRDLFAETRATEFYLGKASTSASNSVNNRLRITIEPTDRYTTFHAIYVWFSTKGNTCYMDLERSTIGAKDTFTNVFTNQQVAGWSGNNVRYFGEGQFGGSSTQTSNYYKYRITFKQTAINSSYPSGVVMDVRFLGKNVYVSPNNMVQLNHLYSWDNSLNATFPAQITATQFNGNLNGIASKVSGVAGTYDASRHVWFSDSGTETARNYDDDFMYNPSTNTLQLGAIKLPTNTTAYTNGIQFYDGSTEKGCFGVASNGVSGVYGASKVVLRPVLNASTTGVEITSSAMYPTTSIDLGTSSNQWQYVYANTFYGALSGNAATATKATQDASGNVITSTYRRLDNDVFDSIDVTELNADQLVVNGTGRFVNGLYGDITGNASTATAFSAAKSVALTGDVTGSASSTGGWSVATTLANSGVTAGSYGQSGNASPAHGGTFSVPYFTVDAKGRVTSASTKTITLPGSDDTDVKVTQTITTTNADYRILFSETADDTTRTETARKATGLKYNPSSKILTTPNITTGSATITELNVGDIVATGSASFTNGIIGNLTGNVVGTATTATYSTYPKIVANNEICFDVNTKPSSAVSLYIGYRWSDGTTDAKINRYIFDNGNASLAEVQASTFYGALSGTTVSASSYIAVNSGNSGTTGGIALYATNPIGYGIAMRQTSSLGTHGGVTGDWATYFTMTGNASNVATRGWIFRDVLDSKNVASISASGHATFDGSVTTPIIDVTDLTAGNVIVTGVARFTNGILGYNPDWNENDPNASGYIQNRICYTGENSLQLCGTVTCPAGYAYIESGFNYTEAFSSTDAFGDINANLGGIGYRVELGDATYTGTIQAISQGSWYINCVGNPHIIDSSQTDNGMPFAYDLYALQLSTAFESDTTFKVYFNIPTIYKINNKYIDGAVAKRGDGVDSFHFGEWSAVYGDGGFAVGSARASHYSFACGNGKAQANYSFASGNGTTASEYASHAECCYTIASGYASHAEGYFTTASGYASHAEGTETIANHKSQHVFGEYNVADTSNATATNRGDYIEIVGKGTSNSARSNARTLDWSGNEVLAGKLTVGTAPTNNMDVATKQYVDSLTLNLSGNTIQLKNGSTVLSSITLPVYSGGVS